MKVIDAFMFNGELDMLEMRLTEMDWCDVHILVEAGQTHRGRHKPMYYRDNLQRFMLHNHKIIYIPLAGVVGADPWERLRWQHNQVSQGLWQLQQAQFVDDGDYLLVSDVDEILPAEAKDHLGSVPLVGFRPRIFMYAVDWEYPHRYEGAPEPRAVRLDYLRGKTVSYVRDEADWLPAVEDAGWHFTWLGGIAAQMRKLQEIAHDVPPDLKERVTSGRAYREGAHHIGHLNPVDVDDSWPQWIRDRRCPESWFRPR